MRRNFVGRKNPMSDLCKIKTLVERLQVVEFICQCGANDEVHWNGRSNTTDTRCWWVTDLVFQGFFISPKRTCGNIVPPLFELIFVNLNMKISNPYSVSEFHLGKIHISQVKVEKTL